MRIAITGATGFVGWHLTRALTSRGHEVVAVARGSRRRPRRDGITFVRTDIAADGAGLRDAFTGCDAVVHLTAIAHERGSQTFDRVNRDASENVAAAARDAAVPHLVHQSALGVDPDPRYPYLASKWAGEQAARASGVPYTVFRPSVIFGPGDGFFTTIAKLVRLSLLTGLILPVAGSGRALFQPISIDDVINCVLGVLDSGPRNAVHEIGGPDHLTYEDIVVIVRNAMGARRKVVHVPVRMLLPPAFFMQTFMRHPLVTVGQLRLLDRNNVTRLDAVPRDFGFQPARFVDSADYLQDY